MNSQKIRFLILLVIIPAVIYANFLSHFYTGDDLQYVMVIEQAVTGQIFYHPSGSTPYRPEIISKIDHRDNIVPINPRYLLEYPVSILIVKLWHFFGWKGTSIVPILVFRMMIGCIGLLLIALTLDQFIGKQSLTLLGSFGIAFSLSYWVYSTHLDQSINMIMLFSLVMLILMRQYRKDGHYNKKSILIPVLMVIATLFNFTAIIISVVISIMIVMSDQLLKWKDRFIYILRYNLIYTAALFAILFSSITIMQGPQNLLDKNYWASITFAGHPEYNVDLLKDFARSIIGFEKSQITYPGSGGAFQNFWDQASSKEKIKLLSYYGMIGLIFLTPIYLLVRNVCVKKPTAAVIFKGPYTIYIGILIAYSAFNMFWDPGYIKYWLIPLICWWMIAVGVFNTLLEAQNITLKRSLIFIVGAFILICFSMNLTVGIISESRIKPNPWMNIAEELKKSPKNALFISNGSELDFYISYVTQRDIISLELVDYETGGNGDLKNRILSKKISSHLKDNGYIYIYGFTNKDEEMKNKILELSNGTQFKTIWKISDLTFDLVTQ